MPIHLCRRFRVLSGTAGPRLRVRCLAAALLVLAAAPCIRASHAPNIRVDRDLNEFLLRLSVRHGLSLPQSFYCQPMHANDILEFLDTADSLDAAGVLSAQESFRLKRARNIVTGKPNMFAVSRPAWELENHVNASFYGELVPSYDDSASVRAKGVLTPELTGSIGRLSYFSGIDVWTELQTDTTYYQSTYEPFDGIPYNLFGRPDSSTDPAIRSSDMLRAGIVLSLTHVELETAIDYVRSGPATHYPLTFSGTAAPLTYFRGILDLGVFEYFHTFGLLRSQKDLDKFFYTHRLEVPLPRMHLLFGINESIVGGSTAPLAQDDSLRAEYYGQERDWEWVYMIPFVPYAFAEHYVGDRDNSLLSFDVSLHVPRGFRWYAEFLLDDITTPVTIFSDDWGNKWGLTAGGEYFGVFARRDIHALLEYSRVEPWVYTHFYGGSHRYTHFGRSLGSPLGPNSAALVFQADIALHPAHTIGLLAKNVRTNAKARGGSIEDVFQRDVDSETKEFLGAGTRRENTAGLFWKMTPFGAFTMTALGEYDTDGAIRLRAEGRLLF
ncbi:MAG: hypothetical protein GF418_04385 [Chitinivibrionales bacterium]|nr:hypothetical protein [Chitinivibrionales bacterium]MBD3394845.1 hypothetical protein [Chitinivibrionales bacterium]